MTFSNARIEPRHRAGNSEQETCLQLRRRADAGSERAQKTALRQLAEGEPYDTAKVVRRNGQIDPSNTYQGVAPSTGNPGASGGQIAPIVTPELNYCSREYREGKVWFYTSPTVSCDRFA